MNHFETMLRQAKTEVVIVSTFIEGYDLKQTLRQVAEKGISVVLIVSEPRQMSPLALYPSVTLRIADEPLPTSTLCIDGQRICTINLPLSLSMMEEQRASVTCKHQTDTTLKGNPIKSHPYLEE